MTTLRGRDWYPTDDPGNPAPEGVEVMTMICGPDGGESRWNVQSLRRKGNLWFFPDMSMYVYYTPTHWKYLGGATEGAAKGEGGQEG